MSATIVSNEIIFFNPYPISSHERCDTEDFDEKGEEEVLHCTYIGKLFIMSMAFDKTFLIHAMIALITKMALIFS